MLFAGIRKLNYIREVTQSDSSLIGLFKGHLKLVVNWAITMVAFLCVLNRV